MWIVSRELRPMAVRKSREARSASYAAAVGAIPPSTCARRTATGILRGTRTATWGSVSVWAAVAEHLFFELKTERENGGKSRGRPLHPGRAHRTGPVVMLVQAPGYRIVRSPSACLNMRIFSSVVRRLPFIRLTPLAKVLRLTLFMDQFSEAQPLIIRRIPRAV